MKRFKNISLLLMMLMEIALYSRGQTDSAGKYIRTAQKPPLDTNVFYRWPTVANVAVSYNGKYAYYYIGDDYNPKREVVLKSLTSAWAINLKGIDNIAFSDDSKHALFQRNDSLFIVRLGTAIIDSIANIQSFKLIVFNKLQKLAYLIKDTDKTLIIRDMNTGYWRIFKNVDRYLFSINGGILFTMNINKNGQQEIVWNNLKKNEQITIWKGSGVGKLILSDTTNELAFTVTDSNQKSQTSLWFYKPGMTNADQLLDQLPPNIGTNLELSDISKFTNDSRHLLIWLQEKKRPRPTPGGVVNVDIWSYNDAILQPQQLQGLSPKTYLSVYSLKDRKILQLQSDGENLNTYPELIKDSLLLVTSNDGNIGEGYWNARAKSQTYIVSINTGKKIKLGIDFSPNVMISPDEKFIIGQDQSWSNFYSYELKTGMIRNLTDRIANPTTKLFSKDNWDRPRYKNLQFTWGGWTKEGGVLLYDDFDIWQIDITQKKPAICLTNQYGKSQGIIFRLSGLGSDWKWQKVYNKSEDQVLVAINRQNFNSGFYKMRLGIKINPELLSMGPFLYYGGSVRSGMLPVKAQNANVYIIQRQTVSEAPNYFWTKDFRDFHQISDISPEKRYNWMTSQLLSFKTLDNRTEHAVIYKPEDFNPQKKYPVIIHYYERLAQDVNRYHYPAESSGDLDVAWFVSHGYVVEEPDIHYKTGEIGESAINSIIAAANYISKYRWVDSTGIGIQGHSFGGYETNYILTKSNKFAGAISSCGLSDMVSEYNTSIRGGNYSNFEKEQMRFDATLWERPDLFIKNSPIFEANRVNTPVLLVANSLDRNVSFTQGVEWFLGLRRLGKPVWMLQYEGQYHGVDGKPYVDYIIRSTQFFDHYLKRAPAPKWMLDGIPAKMKGIDNGFELDTTGRSPGPGLLTPDEQQKVNALRDRKPITVVIN